MIAPPELPVVSFCRKVQRSMFVPSALSAAIPAPL